MQRTPLFLYVPDLPQQCQRQSKEALHLVALHRQFLERNLSKMCSFNTLKMMKSFSFISCYSHTVFINKTMHVNSLQTCFLRHVLMWNYPTFFCYIQIWWKFGFHVYNIWYSISSINTKMFTCFHKPEWSYREIFFSSISKLIRYRYRLKSLRVIQVWRKPPSSLHLSRLYTYHYFIIYCCGNFMWIFSIG